ncbi:MAG: hemolysin family protein [Actinomycetota bacterium]
MILANGFFVAGEFALVAADRPKIEALALDGSRRARNAVGALKTLSFQLSGAQLGITITSLIVGYIAEPAIAVLIDPLLQAVGVPAGSSFGVSITVALILATASQMVVGELVPKNLALARPVGLALSISGPMNLVNLAMKPLIVFLNNSANWTVRLFGIEPRDELHSVHSLEELEILIRSSRSQGSLEEAEFSLLARSISFGGKDAGDALVPRTSIQAIAQDRSLEDLTLLALESGHSRFPVIGRDIDDILGIAHIKDVNRTPRQERGATAVGEIVQEALVVPESRKLESLMLEMRGSRKQLAIVIDEYGGTSGIVTLEDLLEEIVGEIEDEYDTAATAPLAIGRSEMAEGICVVSGMLHPDEVLEQTGFEMPEGDFETLAGFLLTEFDRIPSQGDHVEFRNWEFKVVEMDNKRIAKVLMVAPTGLAPAPANASQRRDRTDGS